MTKSKNQGLKKAQGETPESFLDESKELPGQAPQEDDPKKEESKDRAYKLYCTKRCQTPDGRIVEKGESIEVSFKNKTELMDALYDGPVTKQEREDCPMRGKLCFFSLEKPKRPAPPPSEPKTLAEMSLGSSKIVGLRE